MLSCSLTFKVVLMLEKLSFCFLRNTPVLFWRKHLYDFLIQLKSNPASKQDLGWEHVGEKRGSVPLGVPSSTYNLVCVQGNSSNEHLAIPLRKMSKSP